jgi:hypothetical protein
LNFSGLDNGGVDVKDKMQQCSRCHSAAYCSRECQKKAWPRHKNFCKKIAAVMAEEGATVKRQQVCVYKKKHAIKFLVDEAGMDADNADMLSHTIIEEALAREQVTHF